MSMHSYLFGCACDAVSPRPTLCSDIAQQAPDVLGAASDLAGSASDLAGSAQASVGESLDSIGNFWGSISDTVSSAKHQVQCNETNALPLPDG